jgi:hypothetical protein
MFMDGIAGMKSQIEANRGLNGGDGARQILAHVGGFEDRHIRIEYVDVPIRD